jgi:hypothetical protein
VASIFAAFGNSGVSKDRASSKNSRGMWGQLGHVGTAALGCPGKPSIAEAITKQMQSGTREN